MNSSFFKSNTTPTPTPPRSPKSPVKSPLRKPLTPISLQGIGLRRDLFGVRNDKEFTQKTNNWLLECAEPSKKRDRENDSSDDSRDIRRRRLEHRITVRERSSSQALLLPLEIWAQITSFLDLRALGFFSFACRHFQNITCNFILTSNFWGDKLSDEFKTQALRGNVLESRLVLHLIDRSCKSIIQYSSERSFKSFVDPLYPCTEYDSLNNSLESLNYPSCKDLVLFSRGCLYAYSSIYRDQHDFLFNILSGIKVNPVKLPSKQAHLNTVRSMCDRSITIHDDNNVLFHARKIIEYYIKNENSNTLNDKAIKLLFVGLLHAMLDGDSKDVDDWINFLDSSFQHLDVCGVYIWFTESVKLLKKSGSTPLESANLEEPKKQILKVIESHLLEYLNFGRNYTLLFLLEALNHSYVSHEISVEIEKILKDVCVQDNPKFAYGLMRAIVNDHKNSKSIFKRYAVSRIISFAVSQHGYEVVTILLKSIDEKLNCCDDRFKDGLRRLIIEAYNLSNFQTRQIMVQAIKGFTFNRLQVEFEFYMKLRSLVQN